MTALTSRQGKARKAVDESIILDIARAYVAYRLDGCKDGESGAIRARTKMVASAHGRSYGEVWGAVHAAAYRIIDADPRSAL